MKKRNLINCLFPSSLKVGAILSATAVRKVNCI